VKFKEKKSPFFPLFEEKKESREREKEVPLSRVKKSKQQKQHTHQSHRTKDFFFPQKKESRTRFLALVSRSLAKEK
jgi:hypothetical protein